MKLEDPKGFKVDLRRTVHFGSLGPFTLDLTCKIYFRGLDDASLLDISNKAGNAMKNDNVAMVLNGSFAPTHRRD